VSFGTIVSKLIDVSFLQSMIAKNSLSSWLREKWFSAYRELSSNLLSLEFIKEDETNLFLHLSELGPAVLLADDDGLLEKIYGIVNKRDYMFMLQDGKKVDPKDYPIYSSAPGGSLRQIF